MVTFSFLQVSEIALFSSSASFCNRASFSGSSGEKDAARAAAFRAYCQFESYCPQAGTQSESMLACLALKRSFADCFGCASRLSACAFKSMSFSRAADSTWTFVSSDPSCSRSWLTRSSLSSSAIGGGVGSLFCAFFLFFLPAIVVEFGGKGHCNAPTSVSGGTHLQLSHSHDK